MGLNGTDFVPALPSSSPSPSQRSHLLILDFHLTSPSCTAAFSSRRTLRDVAIRFLNKLFFIPPPSTARSRLNALLVNPLPAPDATPNLALLTETPALTDIRSHPTALARLRAAARSATPLPEPIVHTYAAALAAEIARWARDAIVTFIATANSVSAALRSVINAGSLSALVVDGGHGERVQLVLDDILARLHETTISLSLPASSGGAGGNGVLRLVCRPRVLTETTNTADALTATRLVHVASLPEDVLAGSPHVLWAEDAEDKKLFGGLCEVLRIKELALVCMARQQGGGGFVVLLAGSKGAVVLLREVAHVDSLLPVPDEVDEVVNEMAGDEGTAGLDLLPVGAYELGAMKLGGMWMMSKPLGTGEMRRNREGGEASGKSGMSGVGGASVVTRRVNFSSGF